MVIDLLDRLHNSGDLKVLFNSGVVSGSVIEWRKIYHTYKGGINQGVKKTIAVEETSEVHSCTIDHVFKTIRKMES